MKRKPSLHVTEDRLKELIRMFYDYDDNADDHVEELVEFIMVNGKPYTLENRSVIQNSKNKKEIQKKLSNDKTDYQLLATVIYSVRKQLKHKGIKPIDPNSSEYSQLKKLAHIINEFCIEFNMDKRAGYLEYLKQGLSKISSFRGYLNKLIDMSESISVEFEAKDIIIRDKFSRITKTIHDYYIKRIYDNIGISESYEDKPMKYLNFIKVRELAMKFNVTFQDYIDAQFDGLEWTGTYPEPNQLVNDKSTERLTKYMYQKASKKLNKVDTSVKSDKKLTNILNKIKDGNYNDA